MNSLFLQVLNSLFNVQSCQDQSDQKVEDHRKPEIHYMEHYNEEISIEEYALSRHVSASWFNKSFKKAVGTTPMKYILSIRIRNAQTLLETTDYNISNIASMVGYENAFYFSRLFKKQKGLSPAAYRKIFREKYREHL